VILSNPQFRRSAGAAITEQDLQELERCNEENIAALEDIVGFTDKGEPVNEQDSTTETDLRQAGDVWADHVLEVARAYIFTGLYIFATVTTGWPIIRAIAAGIGYNPESNIRYLIGFLDSAIYFWCPQIFILVLRVFQGRAIRHRMVGRTVVIADCPWVSQAADAFLSKLFACSYSIAGCNVLSANPVSLVIFMFPVVDCLDFSPSQKQPLDLCCLLGRSSRAQTHAQDR